MNSYNGSQAYLTWPWNPANQTVFFFSFLDKGLKARLDLLESQNKNLYLLRRQTNSKAIILLL